MMMSSPSNTRYTTDNANEIIRMLAFVISEDAFLSSTTFDSTEGVSSVSRANDTLRNRMASVLRRLSQMKDTHKESGINIDLAIMELLSEGDFTGAFLDTSHASPELIAEMREFVDFFKNQLIEEITKRGVRSGILTSKLNESNPVPLKLSKQAYQDRDMLQTNGVKRLGTLVGTAIRDAASSQVYDPITLYTSGLFPSMESVTEFSRAYRELDDANPIKKMIDERARRDAGIEADRTLNPGTFVQQRFEAAKALFTEWHRNPQSIRGLDLGRFQTEYANAIEDTGTTSQERLRQLTGANLLVQPSTRNKKIGYSLTFDSPAQYHASTFVARMTSGTWLAANNAFAPTASTLLHKDSPVRDLFELNLKPIVDGLGKGIGFEAFAY